jgi:hypothetical protein
MKIYFDDSTFIWKSKLNLLNDKDLILKEALGVINKTTENNRNLYDAYPYIFNDNINFNGNFDVKSKLDNICQCGIDMCKAIYKEEFNLYFNKISTDTWINVVRSINPVQRQFKREELKEVDKYHTHTEINQILKSFIPTYTYVYYIQMPDVMDGDDGVLYFKGENDKEYWIRPEEDDLIIMPGSIPHAPNNAPKSTIDRVVLAGNVGIEFVKKEKTLF